MAKTILSIGFDDTDSPHGMCTTYLGFELVGMLDGTVEFEDYPRLIRFNPNIPWKTRGNGAVGLRVVTSDPESIKKKTINMVEKYADIKNGANPAVVFYENKIPESLTDFSRSAMWRLIRRSDAKKFVKNHGIESFFIGNGQGLVGAAGVIGYAFEDSTLELLCYRKKSNFGTQRKISPQSVQNMQDCIPDTFNSYDEQKRKMLISPRGPDPVFYGIRGEAPESLLRASKMIRAQEKPAGYMMFRSNQGTGDHLQNKINAGELAPYTSGVISGVITVEPSVQTGGHVFFSMSSDGVIVRCAVYKESGMTASMMRLCKGDKITIGGGVRKAAGRHPRIINAEFVRVIHLAKKYRTANPYCVPCQKRMKSKGKNQGFECIRCKAVSHSKSKEPVPRDVAPGLYLPAVSSQRHLTRPHQRQKARNTVQFDRSFPWHAHFKD